MIQLFQPKRESKQLPNGDFEVTITPPPQTGFTSSTIVLSAAQHSRYQHWLHGGNGLIQSIFPELSRNEREILMSGIKSEEWNKAFGEDS